MSTHFYHKLLRKYVILFGNVFNELDLVTYNSAGTIELERQKVPIVYGARQKYLARLTDTDLDKATQISTPMMAFEINNLTYDTTRQHQPLLRMPKANTSSAFDASYVGVPYDLGFVLSIFGKDHAEVHQIVEQILPMFPSQEKTITVDLIPEIGFEKDLTLMLEGVDSNVDYEGDFDSPRVIVWELTFRMRVDFWGPVSPVKVIRTVFANTFIDPALQRGHIVQVNLDNGNNGSYKLEDTVYQGSINNATAAGYVVKFNKANNWLRVGGVQGSFQTNSTIRAVSTNASYNLASFDTTPRKVMSIKVEPDPLTANADDPYGYTITTTEFI